MQNPLVSLSVVATLLASSVFAQEATTETAPEASTEATAADATETSSEETQTSEEFPVAEELQEPQVGDGYLRETNEKWEVRCIKAPEGEAEECRLFNLLNDTDGNAVAQIDMQALPKGSKAVAGVDIATPLGSLLTAQVVVKIDSGKAKRYPYTWCDAQGCYARFGLTAGEIANMKKGSKAIITIASVAAPDQPLNLELSLSGFTASWNAIAPK